MIKRQEVLPVSCFLNEEKNLKKENDSSFDIQSFISREKLELSMTLTEDSKEITKIITKKKPLNQSSFPFLPIQELNSREDSGEVDLKELKQGNDFLLEGNMEIPEPVIGMKNVECEEKNNVDENVLFDFVKKPANALNSQIQKQKMLEMNLEEMSMMFKEMKEKYLKVCTENLALKEKLKDLE